MFLPNVPGATFIPGATSIPESRVTLILTSFKTVGILLFDALIALIVEPVHAIYQGLPLSIRQLNVIISTRLML